MEQVTYFGHNMNSSVPSTFQILAFLVFSSTLVLLAIQDCKYGNITITPVAEKGPVFTISANCLGSRTSKDIKEALGGVTGKGSTEQSSSNFSSSHFTSSPGQCTVPFTVASFLLNH